MKQLDIAVSGPDEKIDNLVTWLKGSMDQDEVLVIEVDADNMTKRFAVNLDAIQED